MPGNNDHDNNNKNTFSSADNELKTSSKYQHEENRDRKEENKTGGAVGGKPYIRIFFVLSSEKGSPIKIKIKLLIADTAKDKRPSALIAATKPQQQQKRNKRYCFGACWLSMIIFVCGHTRIATTYWHAHHNVKFSTCCSIILTIRFEFQKVLCQTNLSEGGLYKFRDNDCNKT
uniref:Uncharacterized protein n=1 Tax=Glossina pallidipes TaxID=7398 RepID=A0A1A9ZXR4_GLOPL